jgi:hypothetical protein
VDDVVGTEEVDGQVALEGGTVAEVGVEAQARVVDEDVEGLDALGGCPDLRGAGHVQCQRRDAPIRVGHGLPRAGVHLLGASAQRFLDERVPDAAVGSGDQNGLVFDGRAVLLIDADRPRVADARWCRLPLLGQSRRELGVGTDCGDSQIGVVGG